MTMTASLLGLGALVAGAVGGMAIAPGRSDMMSFVNRHNGLGGREPIRFQLGYDPSRRFAHSGVADGPTGAVLDVTDPDGTVLRFYHFTAPTDGFTGVVEGVADRQATSRLATA